MVKIQEEKEILSILYFILKKYIYIFLLFIVGSIIASIYFQDLLDDLNQTTYQSKLFISQQLKSKYYEYEFVIDEIKLYPELKYNAEFSNKINFNEIKDVFSNKYTLNLILENINENDLKKFNLTRKDLEIIQDSTDLYIEDIEKGFKINFKSTTDTPQEFIEFILNKQIVESSNISKDYILKKLSNLLKNINLLISNIREKIKTNELNNINNIKEQFRFNELKKQRDGLKNKLMKKELDNNKVKLNANAVKLKKELDIIKLKQKTNAVRLKQELDAIKLKQKTNEQNYLKNTKFIDNLTKFFSKNDNPLECDISLVFICSYMLQNQILDKKDLILKKEFYETEYISTNNDLVSQASEIETQYNRSESEISLKVLEFNILFENSKNEISIKDGNIQLLLKKINDEVAIKDRAEEKLLEDMDGKVVLLSQRMDVALDCLKNSQAIEQCVFMNSGLKYDSSSNNALNAKLTSLDILSKKILNFIPPEPFIYGTKYEYDISIKKVPPMLIILPFSTLFFLFIFLIMYEFVINKKIQN